MRKMNSKLALIVAMITVSVTTNSVLAQAKKTPAKRTTTTVAKPIAETGPTKEETIAWLKEKLVKYFDYGSMEGKYCLDDDQNNSAKDILIQLNECELTIATIHDIEKINFEAVCPIKSFIPTTNIIIGDDGKISCKINGINTIYKYRTNQDGKFFDIIVSFTKKTAHSSNPIGILINGEVDLYKKTQKAFDHLATFCPKKKELF